MLGADIVQPPPKLRGGYTTERPPVGIKIPPEFLVTNPLKYLAKTADPKDSRSINYGISPSSEH